MAAFSTKTYLWTMSNLHSLEPVPLELCGRFWPVGLLVKLVTLLSKMTTSKCWFYITGDLGVRYQIRAGERRFFTLWLFFAVTKSTSIFNFISNKPLKSFYDQLWNGRIKNALKARDSLFRQGFQFLFSNYARQTSSFNPLVCLRTNYFSKMINIKYHCYVNELLT